jgi:hypothetical protein
MATVDFGIGGLPAGLNFSGSAVSFILDFPSHPLKGRQGLSKEHRYKQIVRVDLVTIRRRSDSDFE